MSYKKFGKLLKEVKQYIEENEVKISPIYNSFDEAQYVELLNTLGKDMYRLKVFADRNRFFSRGNYRYQIEIWFRIGYKDYFLVIGIIAEKIYKYKDLYKSNDLTTEDIDFKVLISIIDVNTETILFKDWNYLNYFENKSLANKLFDNIELYFDVEVVKDEGFLYVKDTIDYVIKVLGWNK